MTTTNTACDCADCAIVAREIARGVDPAWARRARRDEVSRIARLARNYDPAICSGLREVEVPLPPVLPEMPELEAMSRHEEARIGRILRAAARRGAI